MCSSTSGNHTANLLEGDAMQHRNPIKIRMTDAAGFVLGVLLLPASARIADLNTLRALGAARLEVLG